MHAPQQYRSQLGILSGRHSGSVDQLQYTCLEIYDVLHYRHSQRKKLIGVVSKLPRRKSEG